jgi:hypothetical protein
VIVGGKATPPLEAVACVLIAACEAGLANFGSGTTAFVKLVKDAPKEVNEAGATLALTTAAKEEAALVRREADAGKAPLFAAASLDKAVAFETKEPVELKAIDANKAP